MSAVRRGFSGRGRGGPAPHYHITESGVHVCISPDENKKKSKIQFLYFIGCKKVRRRVQVHVDHCVRLGWRAASAWLDIVCQPQRRLCLSCALRSRARALPAAEGGSGAKPGPALSGRVS